MRKYGTFGPSFAYQIDRLGKLKVPLDRLAAYKRTLRQKQIDAIRKGGNRSVQASVGGVNKRHVAVAEVECAAFFGVRCTSGSRFDIAGNRKCMQRFDLNDIHRKVLCKQTIIASGVKLFQEGSKSRPAEYVERFCPKTRFRSVLCTE